MTRGASATILLIGDDDLLGRALERVLCAEGLRVQRGLPGRGVGRPTLIVLEPCAIAGRVAQLERLRGLEALPLLVIRSGSIVEEGLAAWDGPLAYISPPFGGRQFVDAVWAQLNASTADA